jgi:insulin receptor substrate 1
MTTESSTTITGATKASGTSTNTASTALAGSTPTGVLTAPIILKGNLRKLKTNRKKYFVLYGDCDAKLARLDYFDSEKKFKHSLNKNGCVAKRSIALKSCFNINKRVDNKQKLVIALYTKDDCFCIVFENEVEQDLWYKKILELQIGGDVIEGDQPRPTFGEFSNYLFTKKR